MAKEGKTKKVSPVKIAVKVLVIAALSVALLYVLLYIVVWGAFVWSLGPKSYTKFNKERIKEIEQIFDITVTDDVKLIYYEEFRGMHDIIYTLTLEVDDYELFIQNNIGCDVEADTSDHAGENTLYYKYKDRWTDIKVEQSENEGKYTVNIYDNR